MTIGSNAEATGPRILVGAAAGIYAFAGNPNSNVIANPGSICFNTNGGANVSLYVKESGTATNTGWVAK